MSYAITVPRIALGDDFANRLRKQLTEDVAKAGSDEVAQATRRRLDVKRAAGTVIGDLLEQKKFAEDRANQSARKAERSHKKAMQAELLYKEASSTLEKSFTSDTLSGARADAEVDLEDAKEHEAKAKDAIGRVLAAVPSEEVDHVLPTFQLQVEACILMIACGASATKAKFIGCEISGHVEDKGAALGPPGYGIRIWPVE